MSARRVVPLAEIERVVCEGDKTPLYEMQRGLQLRVTGKSRGFAFVEMASADEANKAVEMFHNKEFQGRALTVNIARPREDRPPRSGGGGGGGGYRGR